MNGYLLFGRLDAADGDRLFDLVGPDRPLRAAALGATGAPGAIAAYDATTITAARRKIDDVLAAGLTPLDHLVYAGAWTPPLTPTPPLTSARADARPSGRATGGDGDPAPTEPGTEPAGPPAEPAEPAGPTDPTEPEQPGQPGQPEPMEPGRVFGLPVARDGVLAVTCLRVPPPTLRTAMGVASDSRTAVSPVTGGPWNLLFEHVAADVASLQNAIDGTHAALAAANVEVLASTSLYASHGLFRTTNPNTPPPAGPWY